MCQLAVTSECTAAGTRCDKERVDGLQSDADTRSLIIYLLTFLLLNVRFSDCSLCLAIPRRHLAVAARSSAKEAAIGQPMIQPMKYGCPFRERLITVAMPYVSGKLWSSVMSRTSPVVTLSCSEPVTSQTCPRMRCMCGFRHEDERIHNPIAKPLVTSSRTKLLRTRARMDCTHGVRHENKIIMHNDSTM